MYNIPIMDAAQYEELSKNTVPLKIKRNKPAVLRTETTVIKHIYKRSFWSSSNLLPYAVRFKRNSDRLAKLGLHVPKVDGIYYYPKGECYIVLYPYVPGTTVYEYATADNFEPLKKMPQFIAQLHRLGVMYRDLHTANVVLLPNQEFALIDIATARIKRPNLSLRRRAKNFAFMTNKKEDFPLLTAFGIKPFLDEYFKAACLTGGEIKRFLSYFNKRAAKSLVYL